MQTQRTLPTFRPELVPRWAKLAAWGVLASVMPSVVWRMQMAVSALATGDNPCVNTAVTPVFEWVYIIAILPTVQLGCALLAFGLIRPWGEVFPRWIPVVGGRAVPVVFAAALAVAGALAVAAFFVYGAGDRPPKNPLPPGCGQPGRDVLVYYSTMVVWPPLLLALTWHYVRRRRIGQAALSSRRGGGRPVRG
ncbi:hypothetical protein [Glycomyces tenuis]|uniref:hypothetical protein n=1 Tax=Glycomyces tenuis TaxID=58116 RepID=UPI0004210941|nr:hypothetical protein [Glycomyces tenuis]